MRKQNDGSERPTVSASDRPDDSCKHGEATGQQKRVTLPVVLRALLVSVFSPDPASRDASFPFLHRVKASLADSVPLLPEASRNTCLDVLLWARRGSSFRALFVVSVGTIALLLLCGLLVFTLFFLAATFNAILISLFMSLAAAGGFLAIFFSCVAALYIGALSVAVFVISTATTCAIVAALLITVWVGFFWTLWLALKKSINLARCSLSKTGLMPAYSTAQYDRHNHQSVKGSG